MADAVAHRGPDDRGIWVDAERGIALGFRRLAVLDVGPAGAQPMTSASGRYVLVYNGELYNAPDVRAELLAKGTRFHGHCDTEVFLAGIEQWGVDATLGRASGMFAFALWDRGKRTLTLGRDRLGEKPLYYGWQGGSFLFGSELRSLRAHPAFSAGIAREPLAGYFTRGYLAGQASIYEGIERLIPGTYLVIRLDEPGVMPSPTVYWSAAKAALRARTERSPVPVDELQHLLERAVHTRMASDVPLGALLSGGIDSSLVVALMQKVSSTPVKTFTIGFGDAAFEEAAYARDVAAHLGTDHHELYVDASELLDVVPDLGRLYDEPFADSSQVPTLLVARMARESVTVALSGDGGDEVFGGYNRYAWWDRIRRRTRALPRPARVAVARLLSIAPDRVWDGLARLVRLGSPGSQLADPRLAERSRRAATVLRAGDDAAGYAQLVASLGGERLVLGTFGGPTGLPVPPPLPTFVEKMMWWDLVGYLPDDILTKTDRASMAASLELRAPYLDHELIEAAWTLPLDQKLTAGTGKLVLRRMLLELVPPSLVNRPKTGFAAPVGEWLRGPLRPWAAELLDERTLRSQGYIDPAPVAHWWREHLAGRGHWEHNLWSVLMFQSWLANVESEPAPAVGSS